MWVIVLLTAVVIGAQAQFSLVWNTPGQPTPAPQGGSGGLNPNCVDKLPNCKDFGATSCQAPYDGWAKENCANTCKFCVGPSKPDPPCVDTINNCDAYDKSVCTDPNYGRWAEEKCRYYCRKCSPSQLSNMDAHTTTMSPISCKDKVDCRLYGKGSCTGNYARWAKENCPEYCGLCHGVPKPPAACVDKIPNCASYAKSTCTDSSYAIWVEDHCMKHCGKCGGGGSGAVQVMPVAQGPNYMVPPQPGK